MDETATKVAVALLAIASAVAWLLAYPLLAGRLATILGVDWLIPRHSFKLFYMIPVVTDKGTMIQLAGALATASLPVYIYARRTARLIDILDEELAEFLSTYAGLAASSGSTADALLRAARVLKPPLALYVERMARIYRTTGDLDKAFEEAFRRAPRRIRLLARSIVTASKSGGMIHEVLTAAATHSRESRRLMKMTQSRLSEYSFVVSLASLTYAVAAGIVQALVEKTAMSSIPGFGGAVDTAILAGLYFYSLNTIVLASAIVIAKVVHNYTLLASKYVVLLTLASMAAYLLSPTIVR
ncbi:Type II secretion system (T2SS), protein F [Pyrodictium delaneyi]|uniref:Type II secretion system (T2SS), protein F n=1 Tax=Pyrodictium delaneyi TaxID=1273541 RepID=A0A0P0N3U2_9CREN|nr:type II secretion system F family protein [Pyrodictium delaneyi]ALL00822.1 Type II secretion system (T2SS), protein F [Pyrodictium delaneyi]OWJ55547.1 hypothetical protein Pdsh_01790 [Pyrodictium delaneyi]